MTLLNHKELVAGFMVEHSALPFAFFYLAEYGSILLMSTLTSLLFLGESVFIKVSKDE
jgi:NADH:ubiquinone oxidoreductase subunit H